MRLDDQRHARSGRVCKISPPPGFDHIRSHPVPKYLLVLTYVRIYIYIHTYIHIYIYTYISADIQASIRVRLLYIYIYIYIYMPYTSIYVNVPHTCTEKHIHKYVLYIYTEWCKRHWMLPLVPGDKCPNLYTEKVDYTHER